MVTRFVTTLPFEVPELTADNEQLQKPDQVAPTQRDGKWLRVVGYTMPQKLAPQLLPRACWSCVHYSDVKKCCEKWEATPPADVLPIGCDEWEEEAVPF